MYLSQKELWSSVGSFALLAAMVILPFSHAIANGLFAIVLATTLINYQLFIYGLKSIWQRYQLLTAGILLYAFLTVIGTFWSEDYQSSLDFIIKLFYWVLIPIIIGKISEAPKLYNQILLAISLGLFLHLILSTLQYFSLVTIQETGIGGTDSNDPSGFFGHMSFGFIYAIWLGALIFKAQTLSIKWKTLLYALSIYTFISIFLTHGRSGYIITFIILLIVLWKTFLQFHKKYFIPLTIIIITIVGLLFSFNEKVNLNLQRTIDGGEAFLAGNLEQANERLKLWAISLDIITDHPYFGVGTGDFEREYKEKASITDYATRYTSYNHAHNEFVFSWTRWGPIGFLVFTFTALAWIYSGFKMNWQENGLSAYLFTASGVAVFINAFSDSIFSAYSTLIYAIITLGIASGTVSTRNKNVKL